MTRKQQVTSDQTATSMDRRESLVMLADTFMDDSNDDDLCAQDLMIGGVKKEALVVAEEK